MFRDVLEGSFPELYEPEAAEDPEPEVAAGEGADAEGDADPPAQEDADAAPREGAEGEAAQTEAPGSEAPAQEASDEYEQRIADIEEQVRARGGSRDPSRHRRRGESNASLARGG